MVSAKKVGKLLKGIKKILDQPKKPKEVDKFLDRKQKMAKIAMAYTSYEDLLQWCVSSLEKGIIEGESNPEAAQFMIHLLLAAREDQNVEMLGYVWSIIGEKSNLGQVQTPIYIADYMTKSTMMNFVNKEKLHHQMTPEYIKKNTMSVLDPCIGQAIFHISAKKQFYLAHKMDYFYRTWFYGVDLDLRCCFMSVLNMAIRNFKGIVFYGNFLIPPGATPGRKEDAIRAWGLYPTRSGISNVHEFAPEQALQLFIKQIHPTPLTKTPDVKSRASPKTPQQTLF